LTAADTPGHEFACWFPVGTPENRQAYERNVEAQLPQTLVTIDGAGAGTREA